MHLLQPLIKENARWDEEARGETEGGNWDSELSECTSCFLDFYSILQMMLSEV